MIETFLCFESEGASFLLPLDRVRHIVTGNSGNGKTVVFQGEEAQVFDIGAAWWGEGREREFAVLLEPEPDCDLPALLADRVAGVFEITEERIYQLPEEAAGTANDFLKQAAYIEFCNRWAFVIDIEQFFNKERN